MSFGFNRSTGGHGVPAYFLFMFLAGLSLDNLFPTTADQSGGVRRIAARARPVVEEIDADSIYSGPPKKIFFDPEAMFTI